MPPESQPGSTRPRSGRLLHVTSWSGVGPFWSVGFDPSELKPHAVQNSNRMRSQTETFPASLAGSGLALLVSLFN